MPFVIEKDSPPPSLSSLRSPSPTPSLTDSEIFSEALASGRTHIRQHRRHSKVKLYALAQNLTPEFYICATAIYEGIDRPPRSSFEARENVRTTFIRLLVTSYQSLRGFRVWHTDSLEDCRPWLPVFVYGGEEEMDRQGRMVLIADVENEESGL